MGSKLLKQKKRARRKARNVMLAGGGPGAVTIFGPPGKAHSYAGHDAKFVICDDPYPTPAEWEHSEFARTEAERDLAELRKATRPKRWGRYFAGLFLALVWIVAIVLDVRSRYGW